MHESTRRALCRLAFALLGVLPLVATFGLCIAERMPAYRRARASAIQRDLSVAIGCRVEVASVELRSPGNYLLHGVKLRDPETDVLLVEARTIGVTENGSGRIFQLFEPKMVGEQLARIYELFHDGVVCRPNREKQAAEFVLDGLTVRSAQGDTRFKQVRANFCRLPDQTLASIVFALEGSGLSVGQRGSILISRKHSESDPSTTIKLATGSQSLPCRWINLFAPELAALGNEAIVLGQFEWILDSQNWTLNGAGQFRNLDPAGWAASPLLSGKMSLVLDELSLTGRGLDHVAAQVHIEHGRIHDDLIRYAPCLGLTLAPVIAKSVQTAHPFEQILFRFRLDADGLLIRTVLEGAVVAKDVISPLAVQSFLGKVPREHLHGVLLHAALPTQIGSAPESSVARRLMRWLPDPNRTGIRVALRDRNTTR